MDLYKSISREELSELYHAKGWTQKRIAEHFYTTQANISYLMSAYGMETRRSGVSNAERYPAHVIDAVVRARLDGAATRVIAKEQGIPYSVLVKILGLEKLDQQAHCTHGDADTSPGYQEAVEAVARALGVDAGNLRTLLIAHGLRAYQRPQTKSTP